MIKKLSIIGGIFAVIIATVFLISETASNEPEPEPEPDEGLKFDQEKPQQQVQTEFPYEPDVVMPTKVSRPGCEKEDRCYVPSIISIKQGNQVIWQNQDSAFHSVTSGSYDSPSDLFDSGYMDPYEFFIMNFENEGIFDYFCTLHPWMAGKVIVE